MKKQFDKKRRNPQELKVGNNMWLENINIHSNQPSKKLDNKKYGLFKISKDIGSGAFELELPEGWIIHNVFNKDLLIQCVEPKFKVLWQPLDTKSNSSTTSKSHRRDI